MINPARTPALGVRLVRAVIDTGRGTRRIQRVEREASAGTPGAPRAPRGIFDPALLRAALRPALRKFDPRQLYKNPVMFVVEVTAALVTLVFLADLTGITTATTGEVGRSLGFELQIAVWLWFTVYFATYAEALAEARGKARQHPCARRAPRRLPTAGSPTGRSRTSARRSSVPGTSSWSATARRSRATAT
jgi:K+-transporting ATPase ATPase B chain